MAKSVRLFFSLLILLLTIPQALSATLKDPTRPQTLGGTSKSAESVNSSLPVLKAIISLGNQRQALFEQGAKSPGESVSGYTVSAIKEDKVILKRNNQLFHVTVFPVQVAESKGIQ